jgi:hypothetical protein
MHANMMPVTGPLSVASPVPVLSVKVSGILGNSGGIAFTMPDGEQCKGRWSSAAGANVSYGNASLLNQYGSTYIAGYAVSAGGQNPGEALATCDRGRAFQMEFTTGGGTAHGFGIGKDNKGNIYRMVF